MLSSSSQALPYHLVLCARLARPPLLAISATATERAVGERENCLDVVYDDCLNVVYDDVTTRGRDEVY